MNRPAYHHLLPVLACVCFLYGLQSVFKQSVMGQRDVLDGDPDPFENMPGLHEDNARTEVRDDEAALKDVDDAEPGPDLEDDPMRRGLHPGEVIRKKIKKRWDHVPAIRHDDGLPKKLGSRFA